MNPFYTVRQCADCLAVAAVCVCAVGLGYALSYRATEWVISQFVGWVL